MDKELKNFLPEQYLSDNEYPINHNYLEAQFSDKEEILKKISELVSRGDFTLGAAVDDFEKSFADLIGTKFGIGVGSGTDAIFLSLKSLGVGPGDEVITSPFTFYATIGAIVTAGAMPVFCDIGSDLNINPDKIENLINEKTKAIVPVHWAGKPCNMSRINSIATRYNLFIVEDACHAIGSSINNKRAGSFGDTGCFSFHPLKNLNVWGDGGIICTDNPQLARDLKLLRNHGLINRNECQIFGYNSRLDTIQAIIAKHMLGKLSFINESRRANAKFLDEKLQDLDEVTLVNGDVVNVTHSYHIYPQLFERRDELKEYLNSIGVDAKIHYPIPMHLQKAAKIWGYKRGDFPVAELAADKTLSLPVHEFITKPSLDRIVEGVTQFYRQ